MWIILVAAALAGVPMEEVRWDIAVRGPVAEAIVSQRFAGPTQPGQRAVFTFALPHEGVVDDMTMVIGDTVIRSSMQEARQARQTYEVAARDGQIAGLTTQISGGVFQQELANVPVGQDIEVQLRVLWPVNRIEGSYELVIPTDVAPRFVTGDASQTAFSEHAPYPVRIDADIEAGFDIASMHSPTHRGADITLRDSHAGVSWQDHHASGDLILRWENNTDDTQAAAITSGDHSLLVMEGPAPTPSDRGAVEWVLVLDTSGSMSGTPWRRAMGLTEEILLQVGEDDTVGLLTFGESIQGLAPRAGQVGVSNVRDRLRRAGPSGGTLLPSALQAAVALPHDAAMRRVIVLLTDGLVTDEDGSLTALASAGQNADLAIIGVNASPNRALLDRLAVAGSGTSAYFLPGDTAQSVGERVVTGLNNAKCVDVRVEWSTGVQAWPAAPGPLMPGRPMVIAAQHRQTPTWVDVSCHLNGEKWSRRVVPAQVDRGRGLQAAWARRNLEALLHEGWATNTDPRLKATAIALEYGILSPWTSLVAIESRPNGDSHERDGVVDSERLEEGVNKPDGIDANGMRHAESEISAVDVTSTSAGQVVTQEFLDRVESGRTYETAADTVPGVSITPTTTREHVRSEGMVIMVVDTPPAVNVEDTSRGQVLTREFLNRIPAGRSYTTAIGMAAGVTGGGGNPNIAGGARNENTYMLDGVNVTDPVTGTFSLNFNYDAIEQIEVLLGGYEPEYGVSLGGVVNLVTQTGSNNLEFDTSIFYVNGDLRPRLDARYTSDGFTLAPSGFDSTFQSLQVNARISGPILRDKAWFLLSYQHDRSLTALTGVPVPRDYDGHYVLGKVTVQPNAEHRFTTFLQMNPTAIDNITQGDPFVKPEAQGRQYQGGFVTQARWQWFLSNKSNLDTQLVVQKTFLEVGSVPCTHDSERGYHPCKPGEEEGDVDWDTPGRIGVSGALNSVSYGSFTFDDRLRYQGSTKLSIVGLTDPLGGSHDLKFGVEGIQTVWDQIRGISGNTQYYDTNRVAFDPNTFENFYWLETTGPIQFRTSGTQFNVFAQDAYKPIDNLTIKYGLRFDNTVQRNDVGAPVLTGHLFGPRLYAAWDPAGRGKTKIAGGYGRFNDTGRLAVADFTSGSSFGSKLFLGEFFGERTGNAGFLNGPGEVYDVGPRANPNNSHDTLRLPRVDEFLIMLEQEVIEDVAIAATLSRKLTRNLFEPDETNVIYDEDGSAVIGSRNSNPFLNVQRLRTPQLATRDYVQADFELRKIQSRRWFGQVVYTFTQSIGSSPSSNSGSFSNDPQTQFNFGALNTDINHVVKAYGSWRLPTDPYTQSIGFSFSYSSGQPLERFYYSEETQSYSLRIRPRGQYFRFPGQWQLSLKFQQEIDVRKGKLTLDFEALNLFNNRAPESLSALFYTENRLFTVSRQAPLRLQFGLRYGF